MPPDMAVDMRRTKLKAEEAAILAGEVKKPSWQSKNEGIHERVSFEDSIWGFDLAGGSFYKTPLRVVGVKSGSRAEKAGIRIGDKLKRINDIETSTLTIQEAHEIIIESGIHLRLAVTSPEDEEDSYGCYEDPLQQGYDSDEERRLQEERIKKRQVHAKVSSYWSLQWPWVSKRRIIYRESNCFMVPSKYEDKHKDKFTPLQSVRIEGDIVHHCGIGPNAEKAKALDEQNSKTVEEIKAKDIPISNGVISSDKPDSTTNGKATDGWLRLMGDSSEPIVNIKQNDNPTPTNIPVINNVKESKVENFVENTTHGINGSSDEDMEDKTNLMDGNDVIMNGDSVQDMEENTDLNETEHAPNDNKEEENELPYEKIEDDIAENGVDNISENGEDDIAENVVDDDIETTNDDVILNEILEADDKMETVDADGIINSILNADNSIDTSSSAER